jgi:hypothetical protein
VQKLKDGLKRTVSHERDTKVVRGGKIAQDRRRRRGGIDTIRREQRDKRQMPARAQEDNRLRRIHA